MVSLSPKTYRGSRAEIQRGGDPVQDTADTPMVATLDAALAAADWITPADSATVELLRRLAARMDDPCFPNIDGRFDNVTESLFLKTSVALGLTPEMRAAWEKKERKSGSESSLAKLRRGAANLRSV